MATSAKTAGQIKSQITRFSAKVSLGLDKPKRKFIHQMIYGIQASKDVKLASIARTLDENIPLIKTINRLPRHMKTKGLTINIQKRLMKEAKPFINEDTVLAPDLSHISKEYSEKQEGSSPVRDGFTGRIRDGWPILAVVGADVRRPSTRNSIGLPANMCKSEALLFLISANSDISITLLYLPETILNYRHTCSF